MTPAPDLRVGLCGIGHEPYWPQFEGLKPFIEANVNYSAERLASHEVNLINLGLIDNPEKARAAGHECRRADIDLLFIYVTTYAISSLVLPLALRCGVPIIVLNLQPEPALDYQAFNRLPDRIAMTERWLEYCSACPVPEIANVLTRAKIPFHQVTGVLNDDCTWEEIRSWIAAAKVKSTLASTRFGLLGHYYNGMLDVMTDVTQIAITFGSHIEILEVDELSGLRATVSEESITQRISEFRSHFDVQPDCLEAELRRAARTSLALDLFAEIHDLHLLAYYYAGKGNAPNEDTMSSIILGTSMLTARHIPVAGEYEVKNAIAMKILDSLGAGGSFTEYYAVDFPADIVLMGHDGPGHTGIAQGKTKVRPLQVYHGKFGQGLSVEMSVKHGPVTLLSVIEDPKGGYKLLVAEGECEPGEILQIGNTNSRYRFPIGARAFIESWNAQAPSHHCAIGIGHVSGALRKLSKLLGIDYCQVC